MIEKIQIIPNDFKESLEGMPFESVGRLFLALMMFANDEDPTEILESDSLAKIMFPTLKAHVERHEEFRKSRVENGRRGGAPVGNSNARKQASNITHAGKQASREPLERKQASEDKQEQAETSKDNLKQPKTSKNKQKQTPSPYPIPIPNPNPYIKDIVEIISTLNTEAGTHYGESKETVRLITARIKDGFTVDDFKKVINKKVKEWKGTEQAMYIRPSTLFAPSHFEEYLNAPEKVPFKPLQNSQLHHMMKADYNIEELEKRLIKN